MLGCIVQGPEHLPAYKPGGRLETFDIEELVAEGKAGYVALLCIVACLALLPNMVPCLPCHRLVLALPTFTLLVHDMG